MFTVNRGAVVGPRHVKSGPGKNPGHFMPRFLQDIVGDRRVVSQLQTNRRWLTVSRRHPATPTTINTAATIMNHLMAWWIH